MLHSEPQWAFVLDCNIRHSDRHMAETNGFLIVEFDGNEPVKSGYDNTKFQSEDNNKLPPNGQRSCPLIIAAKRRYVQETAPDHLAKSDVWCCWGMLVHIQQ